MRRLGRSILLFAVLALPLFGQPASDLAVRYAAVDATSVKTSLHLGSATLSADRFIRQGQAYSASYTAKVFPYFFLSENGRLIIDVSDDDLRVLDHGRAISFQGRAIRRDGRVRAVTGSATPTSPSAGKLKVRLVVNRFLTLVFNSTYRVVSIPSGR